MRSLLLILFLIIASVNLLSQDYHLKTGFYKVIESDSCSGSDNYLVINSSGEDYCISKNPIITDADFESVNINADSTGEGITYSVGIKLDSAGARIIKEATEKMIGQRAAFIINNEIIAAPTIRDPIDSGHIAVFCDKQTLNKVKKALKK